MLIEFDDAHSALQPYLNSLRSVIDGAWKDWQTEIPSQVRSISHARSRACMVNDFMKMRGIRLAEKDSSIKFIIKKQMFVLIFNPENFDGCIGIRLKKFDEDGMSKNQPTSQVQDFRGQQRLPGLPADYNLEAGYIIDRFGSELASINLVCPSGSENYWTSEILPTGIKQNVDNLFSQDNQQLIKEVKVRKKSRKSDKKDGEEHAEAN